ncbi:MAG: universal stress protein [Candidatus Lokiarchaeota archaeon]|nr:universal stress protein [Candidatus Lokiarchaeota archaeon]
MIKKVLIFDNDLITTKKTLQFTLELFKEQKIKIVLLDVIEPERLPIIYAFPMPAYYPGSTMTRIYEETRLKHKKDFKKLLLNLEDQFPTLEFSAIILEGTPSNEILNYAKKENFDLVIIGHKKMSWIQKILHRNTALEVVKHIKCPVLIVK